jgi:membrane protein
MRIVFYWTILTLGAVLFFTSVALLSASTLVNVFMERLPGGEALRSYNWLLQFFSFTLLTGMLMLFYRVIPNTRVFWRAALIGGLVVAALLMGNNFLQFLYVKRVVLERSLYGSLAILPVLMFGLYVFWLCVLIGGIVSYALQNVHYRNSQVAWHTLTHAAHERLELVVFLAICRRFRECLPPVSASQLSEILRVPTQLLNECVNRLVHLNLIATVRPEPGRASTDYLYLPARPLNRVTLFEFKRLDENYGEDPIGSSLERIDPLLRQYDSALTRLGDNGFFCKTLEDLLDEFPLSESRARLTLNEQVDEAVARRTERTERA